MSLGKVNKKWLQLPVNESRRKFIRQAAITGLALAGSDLISLSQASESTEPEKTIPWYRKAKRWGQTNITEKDPKQYDITWWRKHWKDTQLQGIIVNAGGIVAYYPSEVPLHRQAQFLEGRDLFGELTKAGHEEGLAVFARMDSNRAHEEFFRAHPDWFSIDETGNPYKAGELYITCINGPYYNYHIPAIQARSDSNGFQQNANTGKLIHCLLGWDKLAPESMAMYQAGRPTYRVAAKPVAEARMWMIEGIAGGIQPWWHYIGAYHDAGRNSRQGIGSTGIR